MPWSLTITSWSCNKDVLENLHGLFGDWELLVLVYSVKVLTKVRSIEIMWSFVASGCSLCDRYKEFGVLIKRLTSWYYVETAFFV